MKRTAISAFFKPFDAVTIKNSWEFKRSCRILESMMLRSMMDCLVYKNA